jgi:hypothetical protein
MQGTAEKPDGIKISIISSSLPDSLYGLVVRVPGLATDPEVLVRFPALGFSEKQGVWNGLHSAS